MNYDNIVTDPVTKSIIDQDLFKDLFQISPNLNPVQFGVREEVAPVKKCIFTLGFNLLKNFYQAGIIGLDGYFLTYPGHCNIREYY